MKKLLLVTLIVGLIRLGSVVYFETKLLSAPIMLENEVNLDMNTINVSYITNKLKPMDVEWVEIDGSSYSPEISHFSMFNEHQVVQANLFAESNYYAIYSVGIPIYADHSMGGLAKAKSMRVHFNDGSSMEVELYIRQKMKISHLDQMSGSSGTEGSSRAYKVEEPFTLSSIEVDDRIKIKSFKINGQEIKLPLEQPFSFNKGEGLYIETTNGLAKFLGEVAFIDLHGVDESEAQLQLPLHFNLNGRPSKEWINQKVQEETTQ